MVRAGVDNPLDMIRPVLQKFIICTFLSLASLNIKGQEDAKVN